MCSSPSTSTHNDAVSGSRRARRRETAGLDCWPEGRRERLLWRFALTLDYDGVADYVRSGVDQPCPWRWYRKHSGELVAILGDDGRYHLVRDDVVLCTGVNYSEQVFAALGRSPRADVALDENARRARGEELLARVARLEVRVAAEDRERHAGRVPHERVCAWWTDGTTSRMFAPGTAPPEQQLAPRESCRVEWTVRLGDDRLDPSMVLPSRRCTYVGGRSEWPPHLTTTTRMGRIRQTLIDVKGSQCHACGQRTGVLVDHDHFTGYVRGLLCSHCNAWIDECPHLDDCPWADYLNNPPAAHLRLRHPDAHNDRKLNQARIYYLGIDPFPPATRSR